MKNWLSRALLVAMLATVIGLTVVAFWPQPEPVDLAKIDRGEIVVTVEEDGKTRIREKYMVSTPLSGRLLRIGMDPGDKVSRGTTLLATIEPRDPDLLDARSLAQAEARVHAAEAALLQAGPRVKQAQMELSNAEEELQRIERAAEGGGATESDLDTALLRDRMAREALRSARHGEEISQFELEQARAALLHSRPSIGSPGERALASTEDASPDSTGFTPPPDWNFTILSPIDGRVLRVLQESSAVLATGTPLLELGDPTDLEVEVDVLSSDAVRIPPGAKVLLEHWGGAEPLQGRVRLVEPAGFTKISTLGVEEQRVNVIVDLVDPPHSRSALGDGFRVEAKIVTEEVQNALRVPTAALFREGDRWAVFVVGSAITDAQGRLRTGFAEKREIKIGRDNGLMAEVLEGLADGETVIVHPSDRLAEGVRVIPR